MRNYSAAGGVRCKPNYKAIGLRGWRMAVPPAAGGVPARGKHINTPIKLGATFICSYKNSTETTLAVLHLEKDGLGGTLRKKYCFPM